MVDVVFIDEFELVEMLLDGGDVVENDGGYVL